MLLARQADQPRVAGASRPQAGLPRRAGPAAAAAEPGVRHGPGTGHRRSDHLPDAWHTAAAQLQGTRLPHALADAAGNLAAGRDPGVRRRLQGPAGDSRRAQLRLAHRSGLPRRRGLRRRLRRELDQRVTRRRLRRTPWRRCRRRSIPTPVCTETSRPICASGSRRFSPGRARRSSCASTVPISRCSARRPTNSKRPSPVWTVSWTRTRHCQTDLPHILVEPDLEAARR